MKSTISPPSFKNLLMPLSLMGCFPLDFHDVQRPHRTIPGKRPIKAGKRPAKEAKRPIKTLVGISVGCLMGCFRAPQPCRKTAPLKRPSKRSMISGMQRFASDSASQKLAAIPSLSLGSLGTQIAAPNCHTNRSVNALV